MFEIRTCNNASKGHELDLDKKISDFKYGKYVSLFQMSQVSVKKYRDTTESRQLHGCIGRQTVMDL